MGRGEGKASVPCTYLSSDIELRSQRGHCYLEEGHM
jgi:hypothetical protein